MSLFGLGKNSKKQIIAVLNFSSSSVGGMLIRQNENNLPEIISSSRVPVNFLLDVDFEAFWRCAQKALDEIFVSLLKSYPKGPDKALCVFGSPWFISEARIVNFTRKEKFKITKKLLEDILKKEEEKFRAEFSSRFSNLKIQPEILEHEFMKAELNGYYTNSPLDKIAKNLKIYIYISMGIQQVQEKTKKEILKHFGHIQIMFKSLPSLFLKVLSSIVNTKEGFMLIDISGEITDILLVQKDNLEEFFSFPKGKNFLLRKICASLNISPAEADSIIKTHLRGHTQEMKLSKLEELVNQAATEWSDSLYKVFQQINEARTIPMEIFIMGANAISEELIKPIQEERFSKLSASGNPFHATKILPESMEHYFKFAQGVSLEGTDSCLMMESLFANKIL